MELDVLVDTGAVMTLLPQDVVEALGLPLDGKITRSESGYEPARRIESGGRWSLAGPTQIST